MKPTAILVLPLTLLAAFAAGQVKAKSEAPEASEKMFRSPMVLELPLPELASLPTAPTRGASIGVNLSTLLGYECDKVVVKAISGRVQLPDKTGVAQLDILVVLYVKPGMDKTVELRLDLMAGDQRLDYAIARNVDAEERKQEQRKMILKFSPSKLPAGTVPSFHLRMTVEDNP
jgi:hypothetical protein